MLFFHLGWVETMWMKTRAVIFTDIIVTQWFSECGPWFLEGAPNGSSYSRVLKSVPDGLCKGPFGTLRVLPEFHLYTLKSSMGIFEIKKFKNHDLI